MAEQGARDEGELRDTVSRALRFILYLTIPASMGLVLLATPLTSFLLRGGAFDAESSDLVVGAIVAYSFALFAHSGIEILSRGFYSLSDTRTPVTYAIIALAVNLLVSLILVVPFEVAGLAAALSIAAIVEFSLLIRALAARFGGLDGRAVWQSVSRSVIATVLMAQIVLLWLAAMELAGWLDMTSKMSSGVALVGGTLLGAAAYFLTTRALHSDEAQLLVERVPLPGGLRSVLS
jgi:putative peptidoglycan lipid II flippase